MSWVLSAQTCTFFLFFSGRQAGTVCACDSSAVTEETHNWNGWWAPSPANQGCQQCQQWQQQRYTNLKFKLHYGTHLREQVYRWCCCCWCWCAFEIRDKCKCHREAGTGKVEHVCLLVCLLCLICKCLCHSSLPFPPSFAWFALFFCVAISAVPLWPCWVQLEVLQLVSLYLLNHLIWSNTLNFISQKVGSAFLSIFGSLSLFAKLFWISLVN